MYRLIGLKELRKARKLTQRKVALDLSISREALANYESGRRNPDINTLIAMSQYFDVTIDYLIFGSAADDSNVQE